MDNINFPVDLKRVQHFLQSKNIKIDSEKTLVQALPFVIECVETISNKNIAGREKKKLAVRILRIIIYQSDLDRKKKSVLLTILDQETLYTTIDVIVDVSKGKFKLNKKTGRRLFRCLGRCMKKHEENPCDENLEQPAGRCMKKHEENPCDENIEQPARDEEVPEDITSCKAMTTIV